jgi:hypothetical protein
MQILKSFLVAVLCSVAFTFAAEDAQPADPVSTEAVGQISVSEVQSELAMRDSVMQVRDSLCMVEKDSLRNAVVVEEAKCANWEQSYQTVKKDNEVCAQALGVAIEVNEKNKNAADEERKKAAMTTGSSFLGGLGIGLLIMWLIMK